ncbi:NAD(P)H-dependent oxidoreductase [Photobacterium sp. 2_MG-2023]|uniref:NAD(P)H-dependent oxidoreductase n=1 Tax=Photobacterium arenosum TaxID=2774143 RepID=A0ABR9BSS0_9GAMM|nr:MULTISPECIES: NAD(P)H-dependent oxidoreductase [Photobacterium]MBD8514760.1 NAD(P)H-dependent oxidoreductase [Photobacterium arenosum]MBV7264094.1 NAD(P)H-dependent oxidoreductase [Photobacterium sp. WH24]MDO6583194.1 NAD(P)H-dependent oxidoreductase [Photobacterium sp. 2_MG-2023]
MKLSIISGSHREQSHSVKAAAYLQALAHGQGFEEAEIMDLSTLNLPLWNEGVWSGSEEWSGWRALAEELKTSDAVVLITPEWHGMATPALKNFLLLCTSAELGHKPVLLASVSASVNGVYPISELRMTGSKNNHACFIPDHLIFRDCETLLTADKAVSDERFDGRARYTIKSLAAYARALAPVREELQQGMKDFPFGM